MNVSSSSTNLDPNSMALSSAVPLSSPLFRHHLPLSHIRFSRLGSRLSVLLFLSTFPPPLTHLRQLQVRRRYYTTAIEERENEEQNGAFSVKGSNGGRDGRVVPTELHKEDRGLLGLRHVGFNGKGFARCKGWVEACPPENTVCNAMHELSLSSNKPFKKCARVVGEILVKFHPHGDTAVYDGLV